MHIYVISVHGYCREVGGAYGSLGAHCPVDAADAKHAEAHDRHAATPSRHEHEANLPLRKCTTQGRARDGATQWQKAGEKIRAFRLNLVEKYDSAIDDSDPRESFLSLDGTRFASCA